MVFVIKRHINDGKEPFMVFVIKRHISDESLSEFVRQRTNCCLGWKQ